MQFPEDCLLAVGSGGPLALEHRQAAQVQGDGDEIRHFGEDKRHCYEGAWWMARFTFVTVEANDGKRWHVEDVHERLFECAAKTRYGDQHLRGSRAVRH